MKSERQVSCPLKLLIYELLIAFSEHAESTPKKVEGLMQNAGVLAVFIRSFALNVAHITLASATMNLCGHAMLAATRPDEYAASLPAAIGVGVVGAIILCFAYPLVALGYMTCCTEVDRFMVKDVEFAWSPVAPLLPALGGLVGLLCAISVESDVLRWRQVVTAGAAGGTIYFFVSCADPPKELPIPYSVRLALGAMQSAIVMLCGNAILAATAAAEYAPSLTASMKVGAAGGSVIFLFFGALRWLEFDRAYKETEADTDLDFGEEPKDTRGLRPTLLGVATSLV